MTHGIEAGLHVTLVEDGLQDITEKRDTMRHTENRDFTTHGRKEKPNTTLMEEGFHDTQKRDRSNVTHVGRSSMTRVRGATEHDMGEKGSMTHEKRFRVAHE
jgi:hypothetical protein